MLDKQDLGNFLGSIISRKSAMARLAGSPGFITLLITLCLTILVEKALHLFLLEQGFVAGIIPFLLDFSFTTLAWFLAILVLLEPALNMVLHLASMDEDEIHFWPRQRRITRKVTLAAVTMARLIYLIINDLLLLLSSLEFLALLLFYLLLYLYFASFIHYQWNHKKTPAAVFAILPLLAAMVVEMVTGLDYIYQFIILLLSAPLVLLTCRDQLLKRQLQNVNARQDPNKAYHLLELIHQSGTTSKARKELQRIQNYPAAVRPWLKVRLHSACNQFMEALDYGLSTLEKQPDSLHLHLAMAEASLGARDPENCAAHAEMALELAGDTALTSEGMEALMLIALGSFMLEEQETAIRACHRILDIQDLPLGMRRKRIRKETDLLLWKFSTQSLEVD